MKHVINTIALIAAFLLAMEGAAAQRLRGDLFAPENLAAWCIVPFDAAQRTPEARAKMLSDLGITKLAYDWRDEHVPLFDHEWKALQDNGIELFAFWLPSNTDPANEEHIEQVFAFLERNGIQTQLWYLPGWFEGYENQIEGFHEMSWPEQIESISTSIRYVAERAKGLGCTVGLYNHGGWFGEPENQVAIIEHLNMDNVGIVYNFQHGRHHINRFSEFYPQIQKHLLCINLVGLASGDPINVTPLGEGDIEYILLKTIYKSGYTGPISIQNHRADRDAKAALIAERKGLNKLKTKLITHTNF
ncbi:hypothetical protein GCM10007415_09510 [Parapedobacter pyrenivorans]|uniref:Xylose isomerase-like TIM barrel domain-containing protein n=1 Tax=Parapedobacter pyrenivorans TaxID=1305674 RepID=A0A917HHS3_9SPHI|nr:TIM barrel protein [Parapedobacter pyrenivorans]GGG79411.1 hypothetical protein GCM10007415_09510 [Parapedobacter pyrenivorans]